MSEYTRTCGSVYDLEITSENGPIKRTTECRVYKRRWIMLCLFVVYSAINLMQWIQFSIIADVIVEYYGVSYTAVDWSSMIYLLLYIPFSFPGSYILDKLGLRNAVLLGMFGTCIGAWIKVASVAPNRYWVVLVGQSFIAIAEVFILAVPPRLAAVWFGSKEVSSACSIGVFGNQLGIGIGFLLPPMLVNSRMEKDVIESRLYIMSIGVAIICSLFLLILLLFFQAAPPTSPSIMQIQRNEHKSANFMSSLKKMIWNRSFIVFLVAYGINVGVYYAISMLLNQIILQHHPNAAADAGIIGLVIIVVGMVGSITGGITLDKYHRFKETSLVLYALSFAATIAFTFVVDKSIQFVYLVAALIGFSMAGVLITGLEVGVELTYPEPEGTSGGLLTTSAQVFGIILTYLYSVLLNKFNDMWANLVMSAILFIGTLSILFLRFDLRRQRARRINEL